MNPLFWAMLTGLAFVVQAVASTVLIPLNLTVVLVVLFGRASAHHHTEQRGFSGVRAEFTAAGFGLSVGLFEDLISGALVGSGMLSKGLTGFLSAMIFSDVLFRWTPVFGAAAMIAFTGLDWLCLLGVRAFFATSPLLPGAMIQAVVLQAVLNAMIGMALRPGRLRIA
ncbi:MAG TPA: hypothetical protein VLH56_16085 [Dissulfurispiraceae bacterium]|nr:hypothetical protein [Dissulfurispiraceae bacterium]